MAVSNAFSRWLSNPYLTPHPTKEQADAMIERGTEKLVNAVDLMMAVMVSYGYRFRPDEADSLEEWRDWVEEEVAVTDEDS